MIDSFIAYIRDIRRYSPRTQAIYREVLEEFSGFCDGELVESLTPGMIRRYEAELIGKGRKARTVHQHLSVLSGFCRFLIRKGVLSSNPVRMVKRPRLEKRLPEYYQTRTMEAYLTKTAHGAGEEELTVLEGFGAGTDRKTARNLYDRRLHRLIVSLLYGTGIRRSELIGLKVGSFDESRGVLHVLGKGEKCAKFRSSLHFVMKFAYIYKQLNRSEEAVDLWTIRYLSRGKGILSIRSM